MKGYGRSFTIRFGGRRPEPPSWIAAVIFCFLIGCAAACLAILGRALWSLLP